MVKTAWNCPNLCKKESPINDIKHYNNVILQSDFVLTSVVPSSPVWWSVFLHGDAVLWGVVGEDLQGQVLVKLPLLRVQTLQGLQLDEGLRTRAEGPVGCRADGEQRVDLHGWDDVLVLTQVKGFRWWNREELDFKSFWLYWWNWTPKTELWQNWGWNGCQFHNKPQ